MQVIAYSEQNNRFGFIPPNRPFIIGVCGGSSSGKTTLAKKIKNLMGHQVSIIHQDSYYRDQSEKLKQEKFSVNFDHPSAIDFDLLHQHLEEIKMGHSIDIPIYDFATHKRVEKKEKFIPTPIIILEGFLILNQTKIQQEIDYSLFLEIDFETRLSRRLGRDLQERGRSLEEARHQFLTQVEPMHQIYVEPSKINAEEIIHHHQNEEQVLGRLYQKVQNHINQNYLKKSPRQYSTLNCW